MTVSQVGNRLPADSPLAPPPKRLRRRTKILLAIGVILFLLLWMLGFSPLHPIWSLRQIKKDFVAGMRDGALARERKEAREAAAHAHLSTAPASQPTTATP